MLSAGWMPAPGQRSLVEKVLRQPALPDDRGQSSAWYFSTSSRNDRRVPALVAVFDVAAALRDEGETVRNQDIDDLRGVEQPSH